MLIATLYDWLMFVHIVAAMVWVGGLVVLTILATQALRSNQPDTVARFVGSLRVTGPLLFAPAMALVLGLGIWMVVDSDAWSFGQGWVRLALGLFAVAFVVGAVFQSRAAILAQRAVDAGDHATATRHLRRWSWGMRLILLVLLVITWDMVFKPGT
jgi:uncharacterized membrane protein